MRLVCGGLRPTGSRVPIRFCYSGATGFAGGRWLYGLADVNFTVIVEAVGLASLFIGARGCEFRPLSSRGRTVSGVVRSRKSGLCSLISSVMAGNLDPISLVVMAPGRSDGGCIMLRKGEQVASLGLLGGPALVSSGCSPLEGGFRGLRGRGPGTVSRLGGVTYTIFRAPARTSV